MGDEASDRVDTFRLRDVAVENGLEPPQGKKTRDMPAAVLSLDRTLMAEIELVLDFAYHELQHILQGHQTGETAKLVEDQCDMLTRTLEILKEIGDRSCLGDEHGLHDQLGPLPPGVETQEVFGVEDTDDVVGRAGDNRKAAVGSRDNCFIQVFEIPRGVHRGDHRPRHHDLTRHGSLKAQH